MEKKVQYHKRKPLLVYRTKIVLSGDGQTGKTMLMNAMYKGSGLGITNYMETIGFNCCAVKLRFEEIENSLFIFQIFDIGSRHRPPNIVIYKDVGYICTVADPNRPQSGRHGLREKACARNHKKRDNFKSILIWSKIDTFGSKNVEFINGYHHRCETSAKTYSGISKLFYWIANDLHQQKDNAVVDFTLDEKIRKPLITFQRAEDRFDMYDEIEDTPMCKCTII